MLSLLARFGAEITAYDDLAHAVLDVNRIPPPEVIEGDLSDLVEQVTQL